MSTKLSSALIVALGLSAASLAQAGFDTKVVTVEHLYPNLGTVDSGGVDTTTTAVGAGVEFSHSNGAYTADVSDANILFDFLFGPATWTSPVAFNGFHLADLTNNVDAIAGVTIAVNNWAGFDASRITFDANNIWVDMQSLTFDADSGLSLDVAFTTAPPNPNPTPEPATLALLGLGLAGLGALRRKA
jgi:hypothetical protein